MVGYEKVGVDTWKVTFPLWNLFEKKDQIGDSLDQT